MLAGYPHQTLYAEGGYLWYSLYPKTPRCSVTNIFPFYYKNNNKWYCKKPSHRKEIMYDLDKKLLDLNNQILSYRLAMNNTLNPFANPMSPPIVQPNTPSPVTGINNVAEISVDDSVKKDEDVESVKHLKGPRGKRGKRGPPGVPGKDGRDFDPSSFRIDTKVVNEDYFVSSVDCFVLVQATKDIDIVLPDNVEDGKILIVKHTGEHGAVIKIKTGDGGMIDGSFFVDLSCPNETLTMVCKGGDWFIICDYFRGCKI